MSSPRCFSRGSDGARDRFRTGHGGPHGGHAGVAGLRARVPPGVRLARCRRALLRARSPHQPAAGGPRAEPGGPAGGDRARGKLASAATIRVTLQQALRLTASRCPPRPHYDRCPDHETPAGPRLAACPGTRLRRARRRRLWRPVHRHDAGAAGDRGLRPGHPGRPGRAAGRGADHAVRDDRRPHGEHREDPERRRGRPLREHLEFMTGRRVAALMAAEIGGSNGLVPISWAARMGLPVVDADGMGRAFPEVPQVAMHLAGISPSPAVMTEERGNLIVFRTISGHWIERLERAAAVEFGGCAASTEYTLTVAQARGGTVQNSVSMAIRIGEVLAAAQSDPVTALIAEIGAFRLATGKIIDVERRTTKGFVRGSVIVEGMGADAGKLIRLELQNENLVALERGRVLASVPDLITVLDSETADAIATESIRYGQRVTVIAFACDPVWRTERGIAVAGPRAFDYDFDYLPVEELARATA